MANVSTNAGALATAYRNRAAGIAGAVRRGVRKVLLLVEAGAVKRTGGSGAPGNYPIPIRSGTLRRAMGVRQLSDTAGLVFNTMRYARAIHTSGFHAYGNPKAPFYAPRAFLSDAAADVDALAIVRAELRTVFQS